MGLYCVQRAAAGWYASATQLEYIKADPRRSLYTARMLIGLEQQTDAKKQYSIVQPSRYVSTYQQHI